MVKIKLTKKMDQNKTGIFPVISVFLEENLIVFVNVVIISEVLKNQLFFFSSSGITLRTPLRIFANRATTRIKLHNKIRSRNKDPFQQESIIKDTISSIPIRVVVVFFDDCIEIKFVFWFSTAYPSGVFSRLVVYQSSSVISNMPFIVTFLPFVLAWFTMSRAACFSSSNSCMRLSNKLVLP